MICSRIRRDDNIVYSSSLLAKGFFPETHIQMMSIIRIKIRIAVMNAVPFSPKTSMERKKSIGCIIARRSKNEVLSVLFPIRRHTLFLNINDWAALPLLMRKSITLPIDTTIMGFYLYPCDWDGYPNSRWMRRLRVILVRQRGDRQNQEKSLGRVVGQEVPQN